MIARGRVTGMRRGAIEVSVPAARIGDVVALGSHGNRTARICELTGTRALALP